MEFSLGLCLVVPLGLLLLWLLFRAVSAIRARKPPETWAERAARHDYERARGTDHLKILNRAARMLRRDRNEVERWIQLCSQKLSTLDEERDAEFEARIIGDLLWAQLAEVPGIGPALQSRIIHEVFRGRLADLRHAYRLSGVGEQRQQAINGWIDRWQRQLPILKSQPFAGRSQIEAEFRTKREELEKRRAELEERKALLNQQLRPIEGAIRQLERVRPEHFVAAMHDPTQHADEIAAYLRGVHAEWEAAPAWFDQAQRVGRP